MARFRVLAIAVLLLFVALAGPGLAGTAAAATGTGIPASTWSVFQPCPAGRPGNCATVFATAESGGVIYLGGAFSDLLDPVTGQLVAAQNVAALDATSGAPLPGFARHVLNGPVFALAISPDGSHLFIGGKFTRIDGLGAYADHLAVLDANTGAKAPFPARVAGPVRAILAVPDSADPTSGLVYLGGDFTSVQGYPVTEVAAVDLRTAALDTGFTPTLGSATGPVEVRSLATGPALDGSTRLYVGGHFDVADGSSHQSIVAVNPATGGADPTFTPLLDVASGGSDPLQAIDAIAPVGTAGGTVSPGVVLAQAGHANRAYRFDLSGNRIWTVDPDGDVQTVAVAGATVYLGGHFGCVENCFNGAPNPVTRIHLAAFSYASTAGDAPGSPVLDAGWAPSMAPLWAPYFYGVWSLTMDNGSLVAGGVFGWVVSAATRYDQPKLAVFPPAALPGP